MQRKQLDLWVGLFILLGIIALFFLALRSSNMNTFFVNQKTYFILTKFNNVGNLKIRAAVKSSGVVIGRVDSINFDNKNYQALVKLSLEKRYKFPKDSSVKILTSGLLGEQYISLEPGHSIDNLIAGDTIKMTQSAIVLENLISQFLYNKIAEGDSNS